MRQLAQGPGHIGDRRRLSLSISRHQELEADRRAAEILSAMGHREPEASMARALRALG